MSNDDVTKAQEEEQRVFEQGRELKKREAEFHKKLDACKQGDQECHQRVIKDELRQQKMARMPHRHSKVMQVEDAMGRAMPVLFNGHPQPFTTPAPPGYIASAWTWINSVI